MGVWLPPAAEGKQGREVGPHGAPWLRALVCSGQRAPALLSGPRLPVRPARRVLMLAHAAAEGQRGEQDEPDFSGE